MSTTSEDPFTNPAPNAGTSPTGAVATEANVEPRRVADAAVSTNAAPAPAAGDVTVKHAEPLITFEHDGKVYTFEKSMDTIRTTGWLRENRRRDELDLTFTVLEEIAGDDVLEVIDTMSVKEFTALSKRIGKQISASFQ